MKKTTKSRKKKVVKLPKIQMIVGFEESVAKKSGLTKIDDAIYSLIKTSAKNRSPLGYADSFTAIENAKVFICTHLDKFAWLVAESPHNWFKTSPVLSTKKKGKNYLIETENSFYTLKRL